MKHAVLFIALWASHLLLQAQIVNPGDNLKPLPILESEESTGCTDADIVTDADGNGAFALIKNDSLVVRVRVGNEPVKDPAFLGGIFDTNISSYSLLIDTDGLVGDEDPNSTGNNVGFEYAVTRASANNNNVYLYNIDGTTDCGTAIGTYSAADYQETSSTTTVNCSGDDWFIDFFIPFSDLPGVTTDSALRFVVVSTEVTGNGGTSTCPFDGTGPTDIYGTSLSGANALKAVLEDQCPITADDLCDACTGFLDGRTDIPTLNSVFVGNTALSGQISGSPEIYIDVFDGTNMLREQDTVTASGGFWNSNDLGTPLVDGDSVIVFALASGQCISLVDESGATNFGVVSADPIPQISDNSSAITWTEDEGSKSLYESIDITDNGTTLASAALFFSSGYNREEDTLTISGSTSGFTIAWDDDAGSYTISGSQDITDYESLLANVSYLNTIDTVEASVKKVSLRVDDGTNQSFPFVKDVIINIVNDAPYFIDSTTSNAVDTLRLSLTENTSLEMKFTVADEENNPYTVSFGSLVNGNGVLSQDESEQEKITFTPTTDFTGSDFFNVSACDAGDEDNCSTTAVVLTVNESNPAPTVFDPNLAISYTEGDDPENLYSNLIISDDGSTLVSATLTFTSNYLSDQDTLIITGDQTGVTSSFDDGTGVLTISGSRTLTQYDDLISSIQYNNNGSSITASNRKVALTVNDGTKISDSFTKDVVVNILNDAPYFVDSTGSRIDTLRLFLTQNTALEFCTEVFDEEGDPFTISPGSLINANGSVVQDSDNQKCLTFNPAPDYIGNDFFILSVCDESDDSNCSNLAVVLNVVSPNVAPDIAAPIRSGDTLQFSIYPNSNLSVCLPYSDANGDNTTLTSKSVISGNPSFQANLSGNNICITYDSDDQTSVDLYQIELCDDGLPDAVCKNYWFQIFTVNVNSAPLFLQDGESVSNLFYTIPENTVLTDTIILGDSQSDGFVLGEFDQMIPSLSGNQLIFTVAPPELFFGDYQANVTICDTNDSIQCQTLLVDLDITPTNEPPIANILELEIDNAEPIEINPIANDLDPENEGILLDTSFVILPDHGTVTYQGGNTVLYTPDRYYDGVDQFTYQVCDAGTPQECVEGTVRLEIEIPIEDLVTYEAFSPNGDQINDQWIIDGIGEYPQNTVRVFDQWNRLVYSVSGYNNEDVIWDGKGDDGSDLPEGNYYFILETTGGPNQKGVVILKR